MRVGGDRLTTADKLQRIRETNPDLYRSILALIDAALNGSPAKQSHRRS